MPKEKFLLVSLSESKAKELAQAISNETCRKILDYLAEKEATESELAEKLLVPISTIHYNLQQLQKGNLVVVDEFHYSAKGKEVNHYKLANKYIIIAPKSTYGIKEKLKSILPVAIILAAGAGVIKFFSKIASYGASAKQAVMQSADIAAESSSEALKAAPASFQEGLASVTSTIPTANSLWNNIILWFFIGAIAAIVLYLLIDWLRNRNR
jgi:DNA-binding transcriptional ArsR family regulator